MKLGLMLQAALELDLTGKLNRHEAHLRRQLKQTRDELAKCQARRELGRVDAAFVDAQAISSDEPDGA